MIPDIFNAIARFVETRISSLPLPFKSSIPAAGCCQVLADRGGAYRDSFFFLCDNSSGFFFSDNGRRKRFGRVRTKKKV